MGKVDISRFKDLPTIGFQPFGDAVINFREHPKWKIPRKIAIILAPTGAFVTRDQNPYQPYTTEEIIKESIEGVEAGACSVHVHVRDEKGFPSGDRVLTEKVVKALRNRFGGKIHIDGEALFGKNFIEMMEPIVEDFYESAAVNCHADFMGDTLSYLSPQSCKATAEVLQAHGKKPLLAVYNPGDIDNTYRWLVRTGIVKPPLAWIVLPGLPGGSPMYDPLGMAETLLHMIRRINDVDKAQQPSITVAACGRASSYLTTLAMMLGCNVRVGKEDTIYMYPHSDEVTKSNKEIVEQTVTLARALGREPMTGPEYRRSLGMKPF